MFHSVLLPDTVADGVFFDMEANFGFGRLWRRFQQGAELLEDFPQCHVMNQQRLVYFREASENGSIGGDLLAHFDEGADDIDAHGDGAGAVENIASSGMFRQFFIERDKGPIHPDGRRCPT
jgi:hypothetical protein